jgi:hypothetical protein
MRFHQNNVFKDNVAIWKRFIRTDFMTAGFIDVDAEMIQPNRFWIMCEDKNYRKKSTDKGDQFQIQIMEERAQASKIPFIGVLSENKNEQSPYVFLNQSRVFHVVTNVEEPEVYQGLPIDIVIFKWLEINNLFENDEEKLEYIKQYNNNVKNFVLSKDCQELRTENFHNSITQMITSWGVNNKIWGYTDASRGQIDKLISDVEETILSNCKNNVMQDLNIKEHMKKPTFEQNTNDFSEFYLLTSKGEIKQLTLTELLEKINKKGA